MCPRNACALYKGRGLKARVITRLETTQRNAAERSLASTVGLKCSERQANVLHPHIGAINHGDWPTAFDAHTKFANGEVIHSTIQG
jgi:hypothetical protein